MTIASLFLFAAVALLLLLDLVTLRKAARKLLLLEAVAFLAALLLIVRQDLATWLAHQVGVGRGVDFVIYPLMIWLFREALMSRHARWMESERIDRLVRAHAIRNARVYESRAQS